MDAIDKLMELDDKHNELLEQLARLDKKITDTLHDWGVGVADNPGDSSENTLPLPSLSRIKASRIKAA